MAFIETPRFPTAIAQGATGGPTFNTEIVEMGSGRESRNVVWDRERSVYTVTLLNRPQQEIEDLLAFFRITRGSGHAFRFKDWVDYRATSTVGLLGSGVGSGVATYQMYKRYVSGSSTYDRKISKPVSGTLSVFKDAVSQTIVPSGPGAGQVSIDSTTGIVTFGGSAPTGANVLTWSGQFDVPVRFLDDRLPARALRAGNSFRITAEDINLIEVLL